ncbi:immunoglobulin domain-containing protein [Erwinia billingiae]|jgi:hypothetical protein|uniref:immunoglobulin domain-containing protein n=2 Tax=Erwinia billingiae TaxID=182337 RepID=UPI00069F6326|nr:immunoglobulin domain-containing protein [Erwinia billingiae]
MATNESISTITEIASFAALRARKPAAEGERVFLTSWNARTASDRSVSFGKGWFIGNLVAGADDGGFIASNGGAYHWRRDTDIEALTVHDFGAVPGGTVDCAPAVKAMYEFMNGTFARGATSNLSNKVGIRFGAGTYLVKPLDMRRYGSKIPASNSELPYNPSGYFAAGDFVLRGVTTSFGKQIATRIVSDKSNSAVLALNHRYFSVYGIEWEGQQTIEQDETTNLLIGATPGVFNDTASNKQPFITNECVGGTFANVSYFKASNTGEAAIYYLDSLDSKFNQIYCSKVAGPVIKVGWSNRPAGAWDHSTAIELSEFNFQYCYAPAIWIPRHGQGLIRNGWIEHSAVPMDINNGQWLIEALSIESSTHDAVFYNSRIIMSQWSNPTGVNYDRTTAPDSDKWASYPKNPDGSTITAKLSAYEMGMSLFQNSGTYLDHPLRAQWLSGVLRGTIDSSKLWLNIGSFQMPRTGTHWKIEVDCRSGYGSLGGSGPMPVNSDRSAGTLHIHVARGAGAVPAVTYWMEGAPGVTEVKYIAQDYNNILPGLWIKLPDTIGEYAVHVRGTGETRMDSGAWAIFKPDGQVQADAPNGVAAEARASMHNGKAGFGAQSDVAAISTRSQSSSTVPVEQSKPRQWMRVNINGVEYAMPYYAFTPQITTQPAATVSVAAGDTLNLTVEANDAASYQWQKSTNGTSWSNISSATKAAYSKSSVTSGDAGQYRCVIKGQVGAVDSSVTTNQVTTNSSVVTIMA